jgi:1,2-diacylglycerol 3-alpha-glucosyltransferase
MRQMKTRLVIITELIAPYRIPVFNILARNPEIDLHVLFLAETHPSVRQWRIYLDDIGFSYQVLSSWRRKLGRYDLLVNQNVSQALAHAVPDLILCGGYNYLASWQAQRWAKRNQVPFLLWSESTVNDQRPGSRLLDSLKQIFFDNCHGFVVPGTSARNYVRQMGTAEDRIFLAPNAVDIDLFASGADSARANALRLRARLGLPSRYFLFVGRLVKAKGVSDLLEAYAGLSRELRSQIALVLAGGGPLRAQLESQAQSVHPGTIYFPGFVDRDELAAYYGLAECLVFPTHTDTWGMVVNEAMACGLPVICSRVAGCASDLIGSNGKLVPASKIEELTRALEEIAISPGLREQMSLRSRELIRRYSPEHCAAGIAEATRSIRRRARHQKSTRSSQTAHRLAPGLWLARPRTWFGNRGKGRAPV